MMPQSLSEIRIQVTSQDADVLKQSLVFVKDRHAQEMDRAKTAENRATVMLAILGVVAGLIIPAAEPLTKITGDAGWFLFVLFLAALLFIVKAILYAIRVIGNSKRYRLRPDTIYDFQSLSPIDALREEIVAVTWEQEQAISSITAKLFWFNRCQRNAVVAIFLLILWGVAFMALHKQWFEIPLCATITFGVILAAILFVGDAVVEKFSIWNNN